MLGVAATKTVKGRYWAVTLAVCTQCGCTQSFTANAAQLAQWVPGSSQAAVPPR
ncbi:MAG: hypothetical protein HYV09_10985 [Deltaproteobacteria bacterium]|nr:hypothetical protein [Deltaproteobacteria bacterium]